MHSVKLKLSLLFGISLSSLLVGAATPDYWEKSSELWRPVVDRRRKILVSAKNEGGRTFSNGVGLVHAPVDKVWAFATDPAKIKKSSRFLKDFKWNMETGAVEMTLEMLAIEHQIRGHADRFPDPENPRVVFKVEEGSLIPFTAELELRSPKAQENRAMLLPPVKAGYIPLTFLPTETLVRIQGTSAEGRSLWWPMRVAMEAILQQTAAALRDAVEQEKETP